MYCLVDFSSVALYNLHLINLLLRLNNYISVLILGLLLHTFQYASFTYQFSHYIYIFFNVLVEIRRVELLTSCLQGRRSSQTELYPQNNVLKKYIEK